MSESESEHQSEPESEHVDNAINQSSKAKQSKAKRRDVFSSPTSHLSQSPSFALAFELLVSSFVRVVCLSSPSRCSSLQARLTLAPWISWKPWMEWMECKTQIQEIKGSAVLCYALGWSEDETWDLDVGTHFLNFSLIPERDEI